MNAGDGITPFRRLGGWLATLLGYIIVAALTLVGSSREWLETDLLHGHPVLTLSGLALGLLVADPWRSCWRWQALLHGLLLGACAWFAEHFLFHADLLVRNDRHLWMLVAGTVAVLIGRFFLRGCVSQQLFGMLLRRDPDGLLPLAVLELMLFGQLADTVTARQYPRLFWFLGRYYYLRSRLGFGGPYCHALERAFEGFLNATSDCLWTAMERGEPGSIAAQAKILARAACTELRMLSLLRRASPPRQVNPDAWTARMVKVWELIGHAERIANSASREALNLLLTGLAEFGGERSWLHKSATLARRRDRPTGMVDKLAAHLQKGQTAEDLFGSLLLIELLVELNLAGWALGFLNAPGIAAVPASLHSAIHRLRSEAENRLVAHAASLGEIETAIHRARRDLALIASDAPELQRVQGQLLPALRAIPPSSGNRTTRAMAGLIQSGPDRGPGATVIILATVLAAVAIVFGWFGVHSSVVRVKEWQPLSGRESASTHLITAAEASPDGSRVFLATFGGGLKELRSETFRLLAPSLAGTRPASLWLTDLAISREGAIAVQTRSKPSDDSAMTTAGLEVSTATGWKQLIPPNNTSSLEADELRFVAALGADKLVLTSRRWLVYRTAKRDLVELKPAGFSPTQDGEAIAAAGSPDDPETVFVAVRSLVPGSSSTKLLKLLIAGDNQCQVEDVTANLPPSETVSQVAYVRGRVLVRTAANRLYERKSERWVLRLDSNSGLDLRMIAHVVIGGGTPTLWLTEQNSLGDVIGIRGRLLPNEGVVPPGPWRRRSLSPGDGVPPLRLSVGDSSPVAVQDPIRGLPALLVPGAADSVYRFILPTELPGSVLEAQLEVERIETPGERVLSLDALGDRLLLLLESTNGFSRRVVSLPVATFLRESLGSAETLLQSVRPDSAVLGGSRILAATADPANRWLYLVTDRGRILTYRQDHHGFTTRQGALLLGEDGKPLGTLRSVNFAGNRLIALNERGELWSGVVPGADPAELRLGRFHRASEYRPDPGLVPAQVATVGDAVDIFFSEPGSYLAMPWSLASGGGVGAERNIGSALLSWQAPRIERRLRLSTVGRLRFERGLGDFVALDEAGNLCWRAADGWATAPGVTGRYDQLVSVIGGSLLGNADGIRLLTKTNGYPAEGEMIWPNRSAGLRLPVTAAIGVQGSETDLWVGHSGGIARYSPITQRWRREATADSTNGPVGWEFFAPAAGVGAVKGLWAVATERNSGDRRLLLIDGDRSTELPVNRGALPVVLGESTAVLDPGGALGFWDRSPLYQGLLPPANPTVGDVQFRRIVAGGRVFAVDRRGRLLVADRERFQWELFPTGDRSVRDVEMADAEHPVISDGEGRVHRWDGEAWHTLVVKGDNLERVGTQLAAITSSSGGFSLIDAKGQSQATPAGGSDPAVHVGERITALLAEGDALYLAGPTGAAVRPPRSTRLFPILDGAGVERFELLGGSLLGWRGAQAFLFSASAGQFQFSQLGNPRAEPVLSPQGKLWLAEAGRGIVPAADIGSNGSLGLFVRNGRLDGAATQFAPWHDHGVMLSGNDGSLLHYDLRTRSIQPVAGSSRLDRGWQFVRAGPALLIQVPVAAGLVNLYQIVGTNLPAIELLDTDCRSVNETGEAAAWISHRDRAVVQFSGQRTSTDLLELSAVVPAETGSIPAREIVSDDKGFWALAGAEARYYDFQRREIINRVSQVRHLARRGLRPVMIVSDGDTGLTVSEPGQTVTNTWGTYENVGIGEGSLLAWRQREDRRHVAWIGDSPQEWQSRIRRPSPLPAGGQSPVEVPGTGTLAWLSTRGEVLGYQPSKGEWTQPLLSEDGWTEIGLVGKSLAAVRPVEGDTEIALVPASSSDRSRWRVPGRAWFSSNAVINLQAQANGRRVVVMQSPGRVDEVLATFAPATAPFEIEGCRVFDSELLKAALLVTRESAVTPWQARLMGVGGVMQSVTNFSLTHPPDEIRVFATAAGWWLQDGNRLLHLDPRTGQTVDHNLNVVAVGWLGADLWCLYRPSDVGLGLGLRRVQDGFEAPMLTVARWNRESRSITGATFVMVAGQNCLELQVTRRAAEATGSPELNTRGGIWDLPDTTPESGWLRDRLILCAAPSGLQLRVPGDQSGELGKGGLPGRRPQGGQLLVQGRLLLPDGWFADEAPVRFGSGTGWTNQVPLVMHNGSRRFLVTPQSVRPNLVLGVGRFRLINGVLQDPVSGVRLGRPDDSAGVLSCDQWRAAIPARPAGFYTLDGLGQVWLWALNKGEYERSPVTLPAGASAAASFSLTPEAGGGILLVNGQAQALARLADQAGTRTDYIASVTTPAERSGTLRNLEWRARAKTNAAGFDISLRVAGSPHPLPVTLTSRGLNVDQPVGLVRLPGDRRLWLHLGNLEDGSHVVSPAEGDGLQRLEQIRLATRFEESPLPQAFSIGGFAFNPLAGRWRVNLQGKDIAIDSQGGLAVDAIRSAATVVNQGVTRLYLLTAQPDVLVVHDWLSETRLGPPRLLPLPGGAQELRCHANEVHARFAGDRWLAYRDGTWRESSPVWNVVSVGPTPWTFDLANQMLSHAGEVVNFVEDAGGFTLEPDVLDTGSELAADPAVRAGDGGAIYYRSRRGVWQTWRPGDLIGRRATPAAVPKAPLPLLMLAGVQLPLRPGEGDATYAVESAGGRNEMLPLRLRGGRFPHCEVTAIQAWGSNALLATLADGLGFLVYTPGAKFDWSKPVFHRDRPIHASIDLPPAGRSALALKPELWLIWRPEAESLQFSLSSSPNSTDATSLGRLIPEGLEIDQPALVRPLLVGAGRVEFAFAGARWIRNLLPGLSAYSHLPSVSNSLPVSQDQELPPGFATAALGNTSASGEYDPVSTFHRIPVSAESGGLLHLHRDGPRLVDLTLHRTDSGWETPFAAPLAAVKLEDELVVLGGDGADLASWRGAEKTFSIQRIEAPLSHCWRSGTRLFGKVTDGSFRELLRDAQDHWSAVAVVAAEIPITEFQGDTFVLRRDPDAGDLQPGMLGLRLSVKESSGEWNTNGLPASWPDSVAWLPSGGVAVQQAAVLRRFETKSQRLSSERSLSEELSSPRLVRHFGELRVGSRENSGSTVVEQADGLNLQLTGHPPLLAGATVGSWQVKQHRPGSLVQIQLAGFGVDLDPDVARGAGCAGGLLVDHATGLFSVAGDGLLVTPGGIEEMRTRRFLPAAEPGVRRLLSSPSVRLTRLAGKLHFFSDLASGEQVTMDSGLATVTGADAASAAIYLGEASDWEMLINAAGRPVLKHPVTGIVGRLEDVLEGAEIFAGGQLAFDQVLHVQRHPSNTDELLFVTRRATEKIINGPAGMGTTVLELGHRLSQPPRWNEVSHRVTMDASPAAQNSLEHLLASFGIPNSVAAFHTGGRIWLVGTNDLHWIDVGSALR